MNKFFAVSVRNHNILIWRLVPPPPHHAHQDSENHKEMWDILNIYLWF